MKVPVKISTYFLGNECWFQLPLRPYFIISPRDSDGIIKKLYK